MPRRNADPFECTKAYIVVDQAGVPWFSAKSFDVAAGCVAHMIRDDLKADGPKPSTYRIACVEAE